MWLIIKHDKPFLISNNAISENSGKSLYSLSGFGIIYRVQNSFLRLFSWIWSRVRVTKFLKLIIFSYYIHMLIFIFMHSNLVLLLIFWYFPRQEHRSQINAENNSLEQKTCHLSEDNEKEKYCKNKSFFPGLNLVKADAIAVWFQTFIYSVVKKLTIKHLQLKRMKKF